MVLNTARLLLDRAAPGDSFALYPGGDPGTPVTTQAILTPCFCRCARYGAWALRSPASSGMPAALASAPSACLPALRRLSFNPRRGRTRHVQEPRASHRARPCSSGRGSNPRGQRPTRPRTARQPSGTPMLQRPRLEPEGQSPARPRTAHQPSGTPMLQRPRLEPEGQSPARPRTAHQPSGTPMLQRPRLEPEGQSPARPRTAHQPSGTPMLQWPRLEPEGAEVGTSKGMGIGRD